MYSRPMGKVALLKAHFVTPNLRTTRDLSYLAVLFRVLFLFLFLLLLPFLRSVSLLRARLFLFHRRFPERIVERPRSENPAFSSHSERNKRNSKEIVFVYCYTWRRELPPLWPAPPHPSSLVASLTLASMRRIRFPRGMKEKLRGRAQTTGTAKRENISLQMYVFWAYLLSMRDYSRVT